MAYRVEKKFAQDWVICAGGLDYKAANNKASELLKTTISVRLINEATNEISQTMNVY